MSFPAKESIAVASDMSGATKPVRSRLRLYIAGSSPRSLRAVQTLARLCEEHLGETFDLEVIDIYQQGDRAKADRIVGVPTLIREVPGSVRRMLGDLSDERRILLALQVAGEPAEPQPPESAVPGPQPLFQTQERHRP